MQGKNLIYIIGFMGSGKSSLGKKLAASLGWSFIDLDKKIEELAGKSIPDLFSHDGEEKFRSLETEALKGIVSNKNMVVSTGGGTPCHGNNMDYMLETGITIYLKLTPAQLEYRLLGSSGERPLLKNIPDEKLYDFIKEKLSTREKWYNRANFIVEGTNLDINHLQSIIFKSF